jgi:protein involved in polysaccharide export with SLBB domain
MELHTARNVISRGNYVSRHKPPIRRLCAVIPLMALPVVMTACSSSNWVVVPAFDEQAQALSPQEPSRVWSTESPHELAPGTIIKLSSSDPRVNGSFRIELDHSLRLPHDRSLSTTQLDTNDLTRRIQALYANLFRTPKELQIEVITGEYTLDVQGLVLKPGPYTVSESTSIDEIISRAGGLRDQNSSDKVRYLRIDGKEGSAIIPLADYYSGAHSVTPHWHGGERLFFQTSPHGLPYQSVASTAVVRVIGQVKNPAEYTATPDSTFFTYLVRSGGPTDRADLARITLIRKVGRETQARTFNSQDFEEIPPIEPGDTILVNADITSTTEKSTRVASSIASILTSLTVLALATL